MYMMYASTLYYSEHGESNEATSRQPLVWSDLWLRFESSSQSQFFRAYKPIYHLWDFLNNFAQKWMGRGPSGFEPESHKLYIHHETALLTFIIPFFWIFHYLQMIATFLLLYLLPI